MSQRKLKLAVLIPDRGDRPLFLANFKRMLAAQTLQPDHVELVDYEPESNQVDIMQRYRRGYEKLTSMGEFDVIALMENDDWYHPEYLEMMVHAWGIGGKPDIFGTDYTIYYHIREFAWMNMNHYSRSCAMSTLIKPGLTIEWGADHDPYADIHIWQQIKNKITFKPSKHYCLGIKHGNGLCGGGHHTDKIERYINKDHDKVWLKYVMDIASFEFYSNIHLSI